MGKDTTTQLAVIGGGPGGYAAAFKAADLGLDVTIIDPEENPGGVCLYRGCIPTKALLHAVKTKREALHAADWGIKFSKPKIDIDGLRTFKEEVVAKLTGGVGTLMKQRKIRHIRGKAKFTGSNTLSVEGKESTSLEFEKAVIASGSAPRKLPGLEEFSSDLLMYAEDALELPDVPEKLLVIGAGYIGLELATVYGELGSSITIAEVTGQLMPGSDPDMIKIFEKQNSALFDKIHLNTKVVDMKEKKSGKKSSIEATFETEGKDAFTDNFERVLVTVGRVANTKSLDLEAADVKSDEKGFIPVDAQRRTNIEHIFAIGDVTGPPLLAHKASHEGIVAAETAAGEKSGFEPRAIPAVEYCDPEIAWCGLTESQAKEEGYNVEVTRFPWGASGRAITMGRSDGLTKLIIDADTERILGAGIVGKDAGELIPEAVLAVEMAARASDLSMTIHPHPTLSETLMEAAELFYGPATHVYKTKKKKST